METAEIGSLLFLNLDRTYKGTKAAAINASALMNIIFLLLTILLSIYNYNICVNAADLVSSHLVIWMMKTAKYRGCNAQTDRSTSNREIFGNRTTMNSR